MKSMGIQEQVFARSCRQMLPANSTLALGMQLTAEQQQTIGGAVAHTGRLWEGFFAGLESR
jgi:hypothetical protein